MNLLRRLAARAVRETLRPVDYVSGGDQSIWLYGYALGFHTARYIFDRSKIAVVHIPKTAGTTLKAVLEEVAPERFVNLDVHRPVSLRCPPGPFSYVTVLRDPAARVWSYYQMARRREQNPYAKFASRGLAYFLDHCWEVRNMACRYLCGRPREEAGKEHLRTAKENVEAFFFVGLFERFDEDMRWLLDKLGVAPAGVPIPHLRPSLRQDLSREDRCLIEEYNAHDVALYEWFLERRATARS